MAGYSASKAAAHSLTQALRPVLAQRTITVVCAAVGERVGFDDLKARVEDIAQRVPAAVRGVIEHLLDHADDRCGGGQAAAAREKARSKALGSLDQVCDVAWALGSAKMSSWSGPTGWRQ
jgi:NAD(P)-dependent dehydrogenase (short-subunit alcohol dehydrogenase family)